MAKRVIVILEHANASHRAKAESLAKAYEKYDAVKIADDEIQQVLRQKAAK